LRPRNLLRNFFLIMIRICDVKTIQDGDTLAGATLSMERGVTVTQTLPNRHSGANSSNCFVATEKEEST